MVSWWADGGVSGFVASSGNPAEDVIKLASNGSVDVQGVTRLQYKLATLTDRIIVHARVNVTQADFDANWMYDALAVTVFVAPASMFAVGKVPTPQEILNLGSALMAWRSAKITSTGQKDLKIEGPRASTHLQPNTKYWVLAMPSAHFTGKPAVEDRAMTTAPNTIGRAVSVWTNRTPLAPIITAPVSGTVVSAGTNVPFTFLPQDPDAIVGGDSYSYDDISGVHVQYAPRATASNPNPTWTDLPWAEASGPLVLGRGWYITQSDSHVNGTKDTGIRNLWNTFTSFIRCGSNNLTAGYGSLPSGEWQIRIRTFDWGHPYPGVFLRPFNWADGNFSPSNAPALNTSPWSKPVTILVSSQVPAPIPRSPVGGNAVPTGRDVTLMWQYLNTATPAYAQTSRTVQIRPVNDVTPEAWVTLVSGNSAASTFLLTPAIYALLATREYEWRVQVTDAGGVTSNYSEAARFWVVPQPATGETKALPSDTLEGASLGCGKHRVYVYRRGGKRRVGELTSLSYVDWNRMRDDISTSQIVVSGWDIDCGNLLAKLQTWAYELVIFRDNGFSSERVWEGPITLLTYEQTSVTIHAKDVMAYAYRRIIKQTMNDHGVTVVSRAAQVLQNAFAPDDPNVLAYLAVLARDDDAKQYRSLPPYSRTAYEEVDDMAANAGLDYTTIGRSILLWGTKHRIGTLPEFRDEDLGAPPIVSEYGMSMSNRYVVSDGNGLWGEATRLDDEGKDPTYGLVEMLSSTWASDSDEEAGTYTEEGKATVRESFAEHSERSISDRFPPPVVVRVPDNTTLNPNTVLSIQQLVPGVVIPLRSTGTLRKVVASQKLDSVKVIEQSDKETITVTMSAFSRDDASTEAPE